LRLHEIWIIEGPGADEGQVRAGFGLAEELGSAGWAKSAAHAIAAVGNAFKPFYITLHGNRVRAEAHAHGAVSGAEILADAAPADPCGKRGSGCRNAYCFAKTSACHIHEQSFPVEFKGKFLSLILYEQKCGNIVSDSHTANGGLIWICSDT
jgi:hypothetical protein